MKDRVPLYPGRVTLTPVSGQANTYDLTRADQPTQEGTPLNKASLLKDATAALYGLPNTAVPDDVLSKIKPLIDSANANANTKARIATGSYTGTGTYGSSNPNSLTFDFEPKLMIVYTASGGLLPYSTQYWSSGFIWIVNQTSTYAQGEKVEFTAIATTLKWFSAGSVYPQQNISGTIYNYIAIG